MEDNSLSSVFGINLGSFFDNAAQAYAEQKGYENVTDLAVNAVAKNVARITDRPNEVKETPAIVQPGAWAEQIRATLPTSLQLSNTQMIIAGLVGVGVIYLLIRR